MRRYMHAPFVNKYGPIGVVPASVSAQERAQLGRRLELRNRIEALEGGGKGILQAPYGPGSELIELGVEVILMDGPGQLPGNFKLPFDKGPVDDEFRGLVRDLQAAPLFDVLAHRLEVSLHAVHTDGHRVQDGKVVGVL